MHPMINIGQLQEGQADILCICHRTKAWYTRATIYSFKYPRHAPQGSATALSAYARIYVWSQLLDLVLIML